MKGRAVSRLAAALIGPTPGRDSLMRRTISQAYDLARLPGPDRRQQYIDFHHANYVATYQERAAVSLGDIARTQGWAEVWNRSRARSELDEALRDSLNRHYRSDVLRVIKVVRASLDDEPFRGTLLTRSVSFGGVVALLATPGPPFAGNERLEIDQSVFPTNKIPLLRSGDTLKTYAAASVGSHNLRVINLPAGQTEVVHILVSSLMDPSDRALISCADINRVCIQLRAPPLVVSPAQPFIAFVALSRAPPKPDTLDFFKLSAQGGPLTVTAMLDWTGASNLDLLWRDCLQPLPVVNTDGATNSKPEHASIIVPGGQCRILEIGMRPNAPAPAFARLEVSSP